MNEEEFMPSDSDEKAREELPALFDAQEASALKSGVPDGTCGFDSHPRHSTEKNVVKRSGHRRKNVSYFSLHYRVRADRGKPKHCENCGTTDPGTFYDWANLTGNYEDVNDYIRLCRRCHVRKDGTWRNLPRLKNAQLRQEVLP